MFCKSQSARKILSTVAQATSLEENVISEEQSKIWKLKQFQRKCMKYKINEIRNKCYPAEGSY